MPSGLTRVSAATASPWTAASSASVRRNLTKSGATPRAPGSGGNQRAAIELCSDETEAHEVARNARSASVAEAAVSQQQPQRIDDHRRVAEPVKEIVRVRIVGSQHRRGHDGAPCGTHGLTEARAAS